MSPEARSWDSMSLKFRISLLFTLFWVGVQLVADVVGTVWLFELAQPFAMTGTCYLLFQVTHD